MLVVAALGRTALSAPDAAALEARVRAAARGLAPIARSHRLLLVHSGMFGHLLARELQNALPGLPVLALSAHAIVPANAGGEARVPCRVAELPWLRPLLEGARMVACVGLVPARLAADGELLAAPCNLDADAAAADLATELGADVLLLLGDVASVYRDWPGEKLPIARIDADLGAPSLDPASIGRKIAAGCRFARGRGTFAAVGRAEDAAGLLAGSAGTAISRD